MTTNLQRVLGRIQRSALLWLILLVSAGAQATPSTPAAVGTPVYSDVGQRLKSKAVAETFRRYNETHARHIQQALYDIYNQNPQYQAEIKKQPDLLRDNIVGPVTLKWVQRFCDDYNIQASDADFADQVVVSLMHVADIVKEHPDWQHILQSQEFDNWINQQVAARQTEIYKIRRSGAAPQINALLNEFLARSGDGGAAPDGGLYVSYMWSSKTAAMQDDTAQLQKLLATLIGSDFANRREFDSAVIALLNQAKLNVDVYLPIIESNAQTISYEITGDVLQQLKSMDVPDSLLTLLDKESNAVFDNQDDFEAALAEQTEADKTNYQIFRAKISDYAQTSKYAISAATLDKIADTSVPPIVITAISDIENINYPTRDLLYSAIAGKLRSAIMPCPLNYSIHQNRLSDPGFLELMKFIADASLVAELTSYRNKTDRTCNSYDLDRVLQAMSLVVKKVMPRLLKHTDFVVHRQNAPVYHDPKQWFDENCSCELDTEDSEIYGFYPFWLDLHKQKINFGLLARVELYGLTFDEQGNFTNRDDSKAPRWPADFFDVAKKYRSRVDWVIYKNDWSGWNKIASIQKKKDLFDTLAANIFKLLRGKFNADVLFNAGSDGSYKGDGITIYFDQFPDQDAAAFNYFIEKLYAGMSGDLVGKRVNIMASHAALNKPPKTTFSYDSLSALINGLNAHSTKPGSTLSSKVPNDIQVLALIESPTTDSKKAMRLEIESALHGLDRMRLLRDTIPVIEYDGHNWEQLQDDIIYFKDNFSGISFWPLTVEPVAPTKSTPTAALPDQPQTVDQLLRTFMDPGTEPPLKYLSDFVCPNRVLLYWIMFALLALFAVMLVVYWQCCECRSRLSGMSLQALPGVVFGLAFLLFIALATCDPPLNAFISSYLSLILFICVVLLLIFMVIKFFKNKSSNVKP